MSFSSCYTVLTGILLRLQVLYTIYVKCRELEVVMGMDNPRVFPSWPWSWPVKTLTLSAGQGIPWVQVRVCWGFMGIRVVHGVTVYFKKDTIYNLYNPTRHPDHHHCSNIQPSVVDMLAVGSSAPPSFEMAFSPTGRSCFSYCNASQAPAVTSLHACHLLSESLQSLASCLCQCQHNGPFWPLQGVVVVATCSVHN